MRSTGRAIRRAPTLQDLEIRDVCIFSVDVELDTGHRHVEEDAVVDLAEGSAAEPHVSMEFAKSPALSGLVSKGAGKKVL